MFYIYFLSSTSNSATKLKVRFILFAVLFLLKGAMGYGQATSVASGAWSDPTVWSTNPILPLSNNMQVISAGTTINGTPGGTQYGLDVKGTLIFNGNYTNGAGGLTIESGGIMIIKGDFAFNSLTVINGTGKLYVVGNVTQNGGNLVINNSGMLVVGKSFTEGWQTSAVNNTGTILVNGDYNVNGDLSKAGTAEIAVLGAIGSGCPSCANSIAPTDPAWIFWLTGNPNLWMGNTNSTWTTSSNWTSSVVPAPSTDIQFASASNNGIAASNDLILDADRNVASVTNTSSKRLVIPPGKCLTVAGSITNNNPNQIYIQSTPGGSGSLIFHNPPELPVQATVEMYSLATWNLTNPIGGKYKWQFFGIPVQSIPTASPTFDRAYVREMRENDNPAHWYQLNNYSSLTSFTGYEITQVAAKTYSFQGALENRDFTVTLPYTAGVSYPGETLIGNSYTAAIDISKIVFGSQMLKTVYLYNTGTLNDWSASGQFPADSTKTLAGQYTAIPYGLAGTGSLPGLIPSMQAFLVRANQPDVNAKVTIPYSSALTVVKNTTPQRAKASNVVSDSTRIWTQIDVTGTRYTDRMWIYTLPDCTHSFDNGYDGEKFLGSYVAPQIYAMEEDGDYQVNSVDDINNTFLGFLPGVDSIYTLTFTHENTSSRYPAMYLQDMEAQQIVDITANGSTYTFSSLPTDTIVKRFKIVTSQELATVLSVTSATLCRLKVFSSQHTIFVDNQTDSDGTLQLYDMAGQSLRQYPFSAHQITSLPDALPQGAYVAKAVTPNDRLTTRLIVHP